MLLAAQGRWRFCQGTTTMMRRTTTNPSSSCHDIRFNTGNSLHRHRRRCYHRLCNDDIDKTSALEPSILSSSSSIINTTSSACGLISQLRAGSMMMQHPRSSTEHHNNNNNNNNIQYNWTRQHLALIVPAWLGVLADPMLRMLDTMFISRMGSTPSLAALGVGTSIFGMAFGIFLATTMATTSLVAATINTSTTSTSSNNNNINNNTEQETKRVIVMSFQIALTVGILVLVILRLGGSWILSTLMGVDPSTSPHLFQQALDYVHTRSWAAPAVLVVMVAEGVFRGLGNTRIPLLASIVAAMINLLLDPILIYGSGGDNSGYGITGAAAATAVAQYAAVAVYAFYLKQRNLLPFLEWNHQKQPQHPQNADGITPSKPTRAMTTSTTSTLQLLRSILSANFSMLTKQGFTVFFYSYAAALATRLGSDHVAAHQVGLSIWLLFAFGLDAASVSGQVLMSRTHAEQNLIKVQSLIQYMVSWAMSQGFVSMIVMMLVNQWLVPHAFSKDALVQEHLIEMIPLFIVPQILISLVLVLESMVVGGNQFQYVAIATAICTMIATANMRTATSVAAIWSRGFITLFLARFIAAIVGMIRVVSESK